MGRRWKIEEEKALAEVRSRCKDLLGNSPPFPEVVGDRRILRFLRGEHMNIEKVVNQYSNFLLWRKENNVDKIRQEIVFGGKNTPFLFPKGKQIIDLAPQIIITPYSRDRKGRPLALEQYCFSPKDVMKVVSIEEYLVFLIYALEYRALAMEQMSHEQEVAYLQQNPLEDQRSDGYGVLLMDYTIRDLKGVGWGHLGNDGRSILKAALDLGLPNYPEYLGKSHMVNVPYFFHTMWYFVKGLLDEYTLAKFELSGNDYLTALEKDISLENIPVALGGTFTSYNEPFVFAFVKEEDPLYYKGWEEDAMIYEPMIVHYHPQEMTPIQQLAGGGGRTGSKGEKGIAIEEAIVIGIVADNKNNNNHNNHNYNINQTVISPTAAWSSPPTSPLPPLSPMLPTLLTLPPHHTTNTPFSSTITSLATIWQTCLHFCMYCLLACPVQTLVGLGLIICLSMHDPTLLQSMIICAVIGYWIVQYLD